MAPTRETYYWVTRTPLFQDEALSSWLIRVALGCGCDPLSLTGIIWPKWRVWTIDIDKGLNQEYLEILARKTAVSQDQLNNATFKELFVQNNELNPHQWILALGTRNRKHSGGWQYCPKCLEEDPVAYYHLNWRYVLHVGCTKHQLRLVDQCPHCHKAAPDRTLSCCAICKKKLPDVKANTIDQNALRLQEDFDLFLRQGYAIYTNTLISISEWLNVIQVFNQFIRKVLRGPLNSKGWAFLKALGIKIPHIQLLSTGLVLSQLSVMERERIFSYIYQLLNIPQIRLIEIAHYLKMNRTSFWDKRCRIPEILQPLERQLDKVSRKYLLIKKVSEIPKPTSKKTILRKMRRLKQKIS
ncbi:TniQ family protein [Acinetobacter nosocomialis]|uniref:TniQ family protein n=1 Tax=Acinetobacter nosocomialis TaxID=106654 RepID=UPI0032B5EA57